jgi:peptide/nickel transport system substrate-binding protein
MKLIQIKVMKSGLRLKRKAVSGAVVAVVVVIIVIAAAAAIYFATAGQKPTAATKDTIVVGTTDSVQTTIDPADAYDYFGINIIQNIGDGLVDYAPGTTNIVPALATSWTVSPDQKVWNFTLRQGVKFADGTPFNASVVKYSIDREFAIDEPEGPFAGVGYDTIINSTTVLGPYQVQFKLNIPFSAFLALVAFTPMYPVDPKVAPMHSIVNYTGNIATENPNGLGPYMLAAWVRTAGKDIVMNLTANPNYWNASSGYPKTKNIVIKFYTDSTSLNLALQSGQVDIAYRQLAASDITSYKSNPSFKVWTGPGQFIQYVVFNEKTPPFNNVLVRQALAAAINRTAITQGVFYGQAVPLFSMIPIGMSYHIDSFKTVYGDTNLSYAIKLLQQAGYSSSNPLKFTLTYPTGHYASTDGIAAQLQAAWQKTGLVQVSLQAEPWSNYKQSTSADQLQVYIYGWYPDFIDPYDYSAPFLPADGIGFLHSHYVNPNMTSLIEQAAQTSNPTQLQQIYSQIQMLTAQDAPLVPLFQGTTIAVSTTHVTGIILDATTIFRYYTISATT